MIAVHRARPSGEWIGGLCGWDDPSIHLLRARSDLLDRPTADAPPGAEVTASSRPILAVRRTTGAAVDENRAVTDPLLPVPSVLLVAIGYAVIGRAVLEYLDDTAPLQPRSGRRLGPTAETRW